MEVDGPNYSPSYEFPFEFGFRLILKDRNTTHAKKIATIRFLRAGALLEDIFFRFNDTILFRAVKDTVSIAASIWKERSKI